MSSHKIFEEEVRAQETEEQEEGTEEDWKLSVYSKQA